MKTVLLIIGILVLAVISAALNRKNRSTKPSAQYHYKRKDFIMTKAENEFFNTIVNAVGSSYYVFPQVHLSTILNHKVKGQNWQHALHYINQKSVDYVICDKASRRPLLAIELDD